MLQPPQTWRVESIMTEANGIYQSNLSPVVQQRAGRLIEKCRKCQQLQAGFAATGAQASGIQSPSSFDSQRSNLTGAGIRGSDALQNVGFGTTYDAHGWLNELVREQGALDSEYVLQDRNGKITHHITAAPGLNLHRYVKSRIGVIGSRGYNHRLKLDHVVASRVIVLDQAR
jgi:hypothetical protein